MPALYHLD